MNDFDSCLSRLFRAAARQPRELPTEAPYAFERRVLAAWRQDREEPTALAAVALVRAAFLCACAILVISAALTLRSRMDPPNELVIVDSVLQLSLSK